MKNKAKSGRLSVALGRAGAGSHAYTLYDRYSRRKYLNRAERQRAIDAMGELPQDHALFAWTVACSGARLSEVLTLTKGAFQPDTAVVAIRTLKRRKFVVREVPLPPGLMQLLAKRYGISAALSPDEAQQRLWPWSRVWGWTIVKRGLDRAGIAGRHACPKGFRHAYGVDTLHHKISIALTRKWLGHASLSSTVIYQDVCGPDEIALAQELWAGQNFNFVPAERHASQRL